MEQIGKALTSAMANTAVKTSPRELSARPASTKPALLDREADYEIPKRVWSSWIPSIGMRAIIRPLTDAERAVVHRRYHLLTDGLMPFGEMGREAADAALSALIGGFTRHLSGANGEGTVELLLHNLRGFPAWAIVEACDRIKEGRHNLNPPFNKNFGPSDVQIFEVVEAVVVPYRKALDAAEALLDAPIETPPPEPVTPPLPTPEEMLAQSVLFSQPLGPLRMPEVGDGKHHDRVAADIAARKARKA